MHSERIQEGCPQEGILLDLRNEIGRRVFPPVDLTGREGLRSLCVIGDIPPDHLVEVDLLAAGRAVWRLLARKVVGIPHVHRLLAGLPLVLDELEGPRPHDLLDLLIWGHGRDPRRHHERHVARGLAQGVEHGTETLGELEGEGPLVNRRELPGMRHQELAEAIPLAPALERLHTVFGFNRLSVVPSETFAQRECVLHAVRRHVGLIDHLRLDLLLLVRPE